MKNELKRLIGILKTLDPTKEEYGTVLENVCNLAHLIDFGEFIKEIEPIAPASATLVEAVKPVETVDTAEAVVPEETPAIEVEVEQVITKEAVRAKLQNAANSGVQIQPIVAKFVPEGKPVKFSEIPQSSYPALLEELNHAG